MSDEKNNFSNEYRAFMEGPEDTSGLSESVQSGIQRVIRKDLVRSPGHMILLYSGLSILGYLASLLLCAQNTFGFSSFSHSVASILHTIPAPWCPIICGSVFTGIPFLLSCLFLSRFQHRYLIFKMWWFFASVPLVATAMMLLLPYGLQHARMTEHRDVPISNLEGFSDTSWIVAWTIAAVLFPYLLEAIVYLVVRPRSGNIKIRFNLK